jgi:hypothetical protein
MLSVAAVSLAPASAGLGGLLGGVAAAPGVAMLGLGGAALFAMLLGFVAHRPPHGEAAEPGGDWIAALGRGQAMLCALAFGAKGALAGGIAWAVWVDQGPGPAIGLVAASLAFVSAAVVFASRALRRR